jgi:hypothetical protein
MYQFQLEQELQAKNSWSSTVINHQLFVFFWKTNALVCVHSAKPIKTNNYEKINDFCRGINIDWVIVCSKTC